MKGPTISLGYFNRPEANRQSFTPDGWFRSGDLGRLTEQGELVFIARLKDIIRVGGENLAPAEVEQALRDVCDLRQVCVVGVPDARLSEVAAAVVVPNSPIEWQAVMTTLKGRLAGYKMPRQIFVCEELPTTATNKVQRTNVVRLILEGKLQRVI
jgi:fatty-acyl-CoA synthase